MPLDSHGQFRLSRAYNPCDIRGVVGEEVQPEDGYRLGRAVGYALQRDGKEKSAVVGGDVRLSTPRLKVALLEGLLSAGCLVYDLGIVPTPAFYFAKEGLGAAAGIMVTASHNPVNHNGFKPVIGSLPNTEEELEELWSLVKAGLSGSGQGRVEPVNVIEEYVAHVESFFAATGRIRVVVDSGNGCCGPLAPRLFRDLGYDVVELFSEPDGTFPNRGPDSSKPGNLLPLGRKVVEVRADLGVAYDGDGDRLGVVDEKGQVVDSDHAFLLFIRDALDMEKGPVVYDLKCSDIVPEEVRALGGVPIMEKTGHTFIKRTFLLENAVLSGELTGHYAFRELRRDDGMVASLRLARMVQSLRQPLSAVVAAMPRYCITPDIRVKLPDVEIHEVLQQLRDRLASEGQVSRLDGVRVQFAEGWGLARASVSAPELTVRFEGYTPEGLAQIMNRFQKAAPALAGQLRTGPTS
jgi:phosphomannomutase/phosphoglucomutase